MACSQCTLLPLLASLREGFAFNFPGGSVLFELGEGSPWCSQPGKIKEPKLMSIIEDGSKSYLFNKVLLISSIACFSQRSFSSFIRIRWTGYQGQCYLSLVLLPTRRCVSVYLGVVVLRVWYFEHALLQLKNRHHILPEKTNPLLHLFANHTAYTVCPNPQQK